MAMFHSHGKTKSLCQSIVSAERTVCHQCSSSNFVLVYSALFKGLEDGLSEEANTVHM